MAITLLRSPARYAALFGLAEIAAVAALIWALGLAWTLLVLAATFMAGVLLAASQIKGQIVAARHPRTTPGVVVADGALVGVGAFLVFLPGILSTAAGALMLAPPTRGLMRPMAAALVTRGLARRIGSAGVFGYPAGRAGRADYIDGEVIDGDLIDGDLIDGGVIPPPAGRLPAR